ncbi:MAG: MCP four helix bundle domain-containing protein [Ignavibacteria bacterium]|nr:MCP four helix bundle domain-containing protein [Ignavibacteria bacterium]
MLKYFVRLRISVKITLAFVCILATMLLVGIYSIQKSIQNKASIDNIYEDNLVPINLLSDLAENSLLIRLYIRDLLLEKIVLGNTQNYVATIQDLLAKDNILIDKYKSHISSLEEQRLYEKMIVELQELGIVRAEFLQTVVVNKEAAMTILRNRLREKNEQFEATINALILENRRQAEDSKTAIESNINLSTSIIMGGSVIAILTALLFSSLLMRTVNQPLVHLTVAAEEKNFQSDNITQLAAQSEEIGHLARSLQMMSASVAQGLRLKQAMESLLSEKNFEQSLETLTDKAQEVMQTRFAAFAMFDNSGNITTFLNRGFSQEEISRIGRTPMGKGLLGYAHQTQAPVRTADISKHQHSNGFPSGHPPMKTLLAVPIIDGTASLGNLYVSEKHDGTPFTERDEESLQTLSNLAAKIISARKSEELIRDQSEYLARSVKDILTTIEQFANGDLTIHLQAERNDDISLLCSGLNRAVENFRNLVVQAQASVKHSKLAASEINTATSEMAATTEEEAAQTAQMATSMEEMARTIADNAHLTSRTATITQSSGHNAEEGGRIVVQTLQKMSAISEMVNITSGTVQRLGDASSEIGEIISVIDEIADQTNLLALNAAIEAARAGESGKGFAVVADEVRKLAERTTQATKKIAQTITQIQRETNTAVAQMQQGKAEMQSGIALAGEAQKALRNIVEAGKEVATMVMQVAIACEQQASTSNQLAQSVDSMSSVVQESAAGIAQIARTAEHLDDMTKEMHKLLQMFFVGEEQELAIFSEKKRLR